MNKAQAFRDGVWMGAGAASAFLTFEGAAMAAVAFLFIVPMVMGVQWFHAWLHRTLRPRLERAIERRLSR